LKRGDVVIAATGSGFGGKPRPALVLQADQYSDLSTVILALITSDLVKAPLSRPRFEPSETNGLQEVSDVMVDILVTTRTEKVDKIVGRLSDDEMGEVERALALILGFAD
jgi:mRNA interferase MazF